MIIRFPRDGCRSNSEADEESVNNLTAALKAQQPLVENAKVQLSYTEIRAGISGKRQLDG